jgi:hypothetical protein
VHMRSLTLVSKAKQFHGSGHWYFYTIGGLAYILGPGIQNGNPRQITISFS